MRHIVIAGLALMLCACAANKGLYQWGDYDRSLYKLYEKPETSEAFRAKLETHVSSLEKGNARVPPGLYAELGTLYLQKGDRTSAVQWYGKERNAWPESRYLMDTMIAALGKTSGEKPQ